MVPKLCERKKSEVYMHWLKSYQWEISEKI